MPKKCTQCSTKAPNTETIKEIPLVSAECESVRQHKIICRLIWVIVLLCVLFTGYVAYNCYFETVSETTVETYEVDQSTEHGNNNCVINGGEICNAQTKD